jgi:hypothetical protein
MLHDLALVVEDEPLPVHDFEDDLVDVDRVGVPRGVHELPDLGRPDRRVLRYLVHPQALDGHAIDDVPEQRRERALGLVARSVVARPHPLDERELPRHCWLRQWLDARELEEARRCRVVNLLARDDTEFEHLPGGLGIRRLEVNAGPASAERLVRPEVPQHIAPRTDAREVDDHVRALGRPEQHVTTELRQVDRLREKASLVADLPRLGAGHRAPVEDEEARLAAVEDPKPVAALLDCEVRPARAVDDDHVAEELRVPDRREGAVFAAVRSDVRA